MMHDTPPRIDPVLNLARNQMERLANIHLIHFAIVSGKDETKLVEFDDLAFDEMMHVSLPAIIREICALGVIISSPAVIDGKYGAVVTLIDRSLEAFYVPIVRLINCDTMVGDFRETEITAVETFEHIVAELGANWIGRGDG